MAIFGRITARQRLRRAARESLTIPAFSSSVDCTPWVTGGLWPAELSTATDETATLASYLKDDLQRIIRSANDELRTIKLAGMPDFAQQAEEARVVDEARARAERRVESTMRQLHAVKAEAPVEHERPQDVESLNGADLEKTAIIPVVTDVEAPEATEGDRDEAPVGGPPASEVATDEEQVDPAEGRHRASYDDNADAAREGLSPGQ